MFPIVKLNQVLSESKVEASTADTSTRIRVRLHAKGVEKRPEMNDKAGATKYYVRRAGQFVYGRQNLHKGAFGVIPPELDGYQSSSDIPSFDVDENCLPEWIDLFLKQGGYYLELSKLASGVGSQRISPTKFLSLEMPLPSIKKQRKILDQVEFYKVSQKQLLSELTHQKTLLKKLRQQILQEAIEGKLTADWRAKKPDLEPASELLNRIAAEKAQLVKDKKIKAQKNLPSITAEEKPFQLPLGWEWCRLGEYARFERGRFSIRPRNDPTCFGGEYPFIQIGSLDSIGTIVTDYKQTLNEKGFKASKLFLMGTIMVAIVGGTIGNLGVLGKDMCFPDSMVGVQPNKTTSQDYILLLLKYFRPYVLSLSYQMAGQPNIKLPTLNNLVLALPPLLEQEAIVTKVENLLDLCDQLETQITENQSHAEQLMQAVLKEAFSHNSAAEPAATAPKATAHA
ncbi:restriction endonuclease subunit S [Haliea alexandrii]|uniref:restriction endonuclease subunit S n=1 Tax=Haliea alexandrii TaxID=2448162 RepID=UPI001304E7EF|nr:restriction endonuclease subunit S [Haliea alexandrii]